MDEFLERRKKLAANMQKNSIALLPGATEQYRNGHHEYPFRQYSSFYYLTGFKEPQAFMALCKNAKGEVNFILLNRTHDSDQEVWTGKRAGQEGARKIYGADEAFDIASIDEVIPFLLCDKQVLYYPMAVLPELDQKVMQWLTQAKRNVGHRAYREAHSASFVPDTLSDLMPLIDEMRLFKSEQEIELMRKAADISAAAHIKLMQACKPGLMEYQLEALFNSHCCYDGCRAVAYPSIIAGGNNACTLHYEANDQALNNGDLVLVDAGGEYNYYASDITRTFPVNGKFSPAQKQIYEVVLKAQLAGIEQVKPGNTFEMVEGTIIENIVAGLLELGILSGDAKELIKSHAYRKYYMHSCGHWLGLDVHDVGKHKIDNKWRKFEPGMVLTVEPGIYINNNSTDVDAKWLGIGIRIEDDVLVTKKGNEVLSNKAPKTVEDLERAAV